MFQVGLLGSTTIISEQRGVASLMSPVHVHLQEEEARGWGGGSEVN